MTVLLVQVKENKKHRKNIFKKNYILFKKLKIKRKRKQNYFFNNALIADYFSTFWYFKRI